MNPDDAAARLLEQMAPWQIEYDEGQRPIEPGLHLTVETPGERRANFTSGAYEFRPSDLMRVTIEGNRDQVAPLAQLMFDEYQRRHPAAGGARS